MGFIIKRTAPAETLDKYGRVKSVITNIAKQGDFFRITFKIGEQTATDLFPEDPERNSRLKRLYFRSGAAQATPEGEEWQTDRLLNRSVEGVWGYVIKEGTKYPRLVSFKELDEDTPDKVESLTQAEWEDYNCDKTGKWHNPNN